MLLKANKTFETNSDCLPDLNKFVSSTLKQTKTDPKMQSKYIIAIESIVAGLIKKNVENSRFTIKISANSFKTRIRIEAEGPEIHESIDKLLVDEFFLDEMLANKDLKDFSLSTLGLEVSNRYKDNCNYYYISNTNQSHTKLAKTLSFMLAGAIVGILIRLFVPANIGVIVAENLFDTVYTLFLNAVKMALAPLIFLSIISSIASYSNISEIRKIARSTFRIFITFTLISMALAICADKFVCITDANLTGKYVVDDQIDYGGSDDIIAIISKTITAFIPTNIITPFLNSTITQVIFMAVLIGVGLMLLGDKVSGLTEFFNKLNTLVNKIVSLIIYFMPVAIFCSLASMIIIQDINSILTIFKLLLLCLGAHAILVIIYFVCVGLFSNTKIRDFVKHFTPVCLMAYILASSAAAMPDAIKTSIEKLKTPREVAFFSIPLGSTINLNASITTVTIISLFFMRHAGVDLTLEVMLVFIIDIFSIAMGTPAIPGGGIVLITTMITSFGVPVDITTLIVGVYPIIDMFNSSINTLSTGAATQVVTKSVLKSEAKD